MTLLKWRTSILFIPILLLILVSVSFSDTATQTDWFGGGGVHGPVTDWGNSYDVADQINDSGSSLRLASVVLFSPVDENFNGAHSVYAAGALESSILDADTVDSWELFASSKQEPAGTSVGFQFRSSNDSANMGA